jgi:ParB family chromosome partitioning protein
MPLGKGLNALISEIEGEEISKDTGAVDIPVNKIKPNKLQPRKYFNDEELSGLISSIKEKGVVQPILVRKVENGFYEIIAGERRWRAVSSIGLDTIPAILKEASNSEAFELALIENIQRSDLNPIEEANAYRRLLDEFSITHDDLSKRVGKDRATITNSIRLLKLPDDVQEYIVRGDISSGHAKALLSLDLESNIRAVCIKIIQKGLSVRETEVIINNIKSPTLKQKKKSQVDLHQREIEDDLKRVFGTKVKIIPNKNGGKIEIEYYSHEDLERIIEIIKK